MWNLSAPKTYRVFGDRVVASRDGNYCASSKGATVGVQKIADVDAATITAAAPVTAMRLSADSEWLLLGTQTGVLSLWDLPNGREVQTWKWHSAPITHLAVSFSGQYAISGDDRGAIAFWDIESSNPEPLWTDTKVAGSIFSVFFSSSGSRVGVVRRNGNLTEYGCQQTRDVVFSQHLIEPPVEIVGFYYGPNRFIVLATSDGFLEIIRGSHDRIKSGLTISMGQVSCLMVTENQEHVICGHRTGMLSVWSATTLGLIGATTAHHHSVQMICMSRDIRGCFFTSAQGEECVYWWKCEMFS